jgi:DNA helicase II / ATP-dependent DNA helicase PcrA
MESFAGSSYTTPGWQRAQAAKAAGSAGGASSGPASGFGGRSFGGSSGGPKLIEGEILARSSGSSSSFKTGDRVFHIKFGPGEVALVDGNKLTVDFDKAGRKMVIESFLQRG